MSEGANLLLGMDKHIQKAVSFVMVLHERQTRKDTDIPYVSHLFSVAALVMEANGTKEEIIGALLHDAVEDQGGQPTLDKIRDLFGDDVAAIVNGCTDHIPEDGKEKPSWRERKEQYLSHLASSTRSVRLVSNADKLHNARSIVRDYRGIGPEIWNRFSVPRQETLWYYRSLANVFLEHPADQFLSQELGRTVSELESMD